jgi:hypothetical protein
MCELDFDEGATVWDERLIGRARKEHRCDTCNIAIGVGQSYMAHFSVFDGHASHEKQCLRCRAIGDAFTREHRSSVTPGSLLEFLDQCLDEERWVVALEEDADDDNDGKAPRNQLPSQLSETGLRWKYALVEIRARRGAA